MRNYARNFKILKSTLFGCSMTFVLTACGFVENTVKTSDTKAVERPATDMTRKTDSAINSADAPTVSNSPAVTAYE